MAEHERFEVLEAVRGVAALLVVAAHCLLVWPAVADAYFGGPGQGAPWAQALVYSPLHLFWGGMEEIILFYVLSGFVLALPFVAGHAPGYGAYLVKRFFRIYPPYLAAVALAMGLVLLLAPAGVPGLSAWFHRQWLAPVTAAAALDHLRLGGAALTSPFNGPVWTLVHEARVSVVFPLMVAVVLRLPALGVAALVAGWYLASGALLRSPWAHAQVGLTWLVTAQHATYFLIGAALAKYREPLVAWAASLGRPRLLLLGLALLVAYKVRWLAPGMVRGQELLVGASAGMILILALAVPRLRAALDTPGLRWLGRVSYSLYLVHMLVLLGLMYTVAPLITPVGAVALTVPVALALAHLGQRLVEAPAMAWGRRLAARLAPR